MIPRKIDDVTCGILAGGASLRMGTDKAWMEREGRPLIQDLVERLSPGCAEVLLSGADPRLESLGRRVPDLLPERCALTGIHSLLHHSRTNWCFIVACDMPFVHPGLLEFFSTKREGADIVAARTSRGIEPLPALYSRNILPAIENAARIGHWKITDVFPAVRAAVLPVGEERVWWWEGGPPFFNANTPVEWEEARRLWRKKEPNPGPGAGR